LQEGINVSEPIYIPLNPGNLLAVQIARCAKPTLWQKDRKFPSQITDAADHNKPVTENSGIKIPTSLSDCSAIYIGIFFPQYISELRWLSFKIR
jgi:hypothetical protein